MKAKQGKIVKLHTHDLNYFLAKHFFGDDDFQNMFVYQRTLSTLELKEIQEHRLYFLLDIKAVIYF